MLSDLERPPPPGTEAAKTGLPYPRPSQFIQSLYDLAALRILVSLQEQGELGTAA